MYSARRASMRPAQLPQRRLVGPGVGGDLLDPREQVADARLERRVELDMERVRASAAR